MPFRGIICGSVWLSENYTPERHTFPRYNPRKVLTFCRLTAENQTSCTNISAISWKNIKQFLDIHQGAIRFWLMKKNETKKYLATVPLRVPFEVDFLISNLFSRYFKMCKNWGIGVEIESDFLQQTIPQPLFSCICTVCSRIKTEHYMCVHC
jgi:hypothetical protein